MVILNELEQGSSSSHDHRYDVFLSFRGFDTRLSFTNHLHTALVNANLTTFLDNEEIPTGEELKPELESAIKASRASVIVLSKNYASSRWCLDELVLILEQHRNFNQIVIPIFYHVDPTNVRKQQGSFGDAMAEHKQRMDEETDAEKRSQWARKIELWKEALKEVADLRGKDANGRLETEFIEEIVKDVYHRLGVPLKITQPLLFGMDHSIKFVTSWLKEGPSHTTHILTISGIGGIGKTSLAKYVSGLHCREFKRSSFIEDISRRCANHNGLLDVQKQLCHDITKTSSIQVHDVSVYTSMIENALTRIKVLLVLDDIDSLVQLNALLGNKVFHSGSKIIITTKDASLTESCALFHMKLKPQHVKHEIKGLNGKPSLELLCYHAFSCNNPKEGYEEVSKKLVKYCDGHPLALEILGSSLRTKDATYWEGFIEGLKKELLPDLRVKKALQMSFDSLPSQNDKDLFKHISCFFVGMDRDISETILRACDINTTTGITHLIDRSLLHIDRNELTMHSLIQEMGRDVVRQESPDHPEKRTRLWCHEESFKVLKKKKGTENIKGLVLDMRMLEKQKLPFELKTDALNNMDNLMILHLNYVQLSGSYENFPEELRWLCMHGFPLKSIPSDLPVENLVVLDMSYSNIESFDLTYSNPQTPAQRQNQLIGSCSKAKPLLESLKILDLSFCDQLRSLRGFCELPALERLIVKKCTSLIEVCESVEQCGELVFVDLSYCYEFRNVAKTIDKLKNVKTLLLDGCNFGECSFTVRDMDSLKMPNTNNIDINSQTFSTAIVEAIPRYLKSLAISLPRLLVSLSLVDNNLSNESFPIDLSSLSVLKELYLDENPIVSMPNCVRRLPRLEFLSMGDCEMMMSIDQPPPTLKKLRFGTIKRYYEPLLQKIVFDSEMSPLWLIVNINELPPLSFLLEGVVKIQSMACVEETLLRSLGWNNLEFVKKMCVETYNRRIEEPDESESDSQMMYYEFGIFSTIYGGRKMPNWIKLRRNGDSISFTIPSYPKLAGLNFCFVSSKYTVDHFFELPWMQISNITKNRTWIYKHYSQRVKVVGKCVTFLSHWMFGIDDLEAGDQVNATVRHVYATHLTKTCGVSIVYDDGSTEAEDALGYYKSWNHIIGGDLSPFQKTTGEYILQKYRFMGLDNFIINPFSNDEANYKVSEDQLYFKAFSQRKSKHTGQAIEDISQDEAEEVYLYYYIKNIVKMLNFKTFLRGTIFNI